MAYEKPALHKPDELATALNRDTYLLVGDYRSGRSRNNYFHYAAHFPDSTREDALSDARALARWAETEVVNREITLNRSSIVATSHGVYVLGINDGYFWGWHCYYVPRDDRQMVYVAKYDGDRVAELRDRLDGWQSNWGFAPQYRITREGDSDLEFPPMLLYTDL